MLKISEAYFRLLFSVENGESYIQDIGELMSSLPQVIQTDSDVILEILALNAGNITVGLLGLHKEDRATVAEVIMQHIPTLGFTIINGTMRHKENPDGTIDFIFTIR